MKPKPTALIIDGERGIRRLVRTVLGPQHYKVAEAENGQRGLKAAVEQRPDIIILELDLPDIDGLIVLRRIREWSQKPVIILSDRIAPLDKVSAFNDGADDYLTKPFHTSELLARIRAIQRRLLGVPDSPLLVEGDIKVNLNTHEVLIKGQKVDFSPTEEALFYLLAHHAGKTVTRKHLARCVWGLDAVDKAGDVRVYIAHLRKKLGVYGGEMLIRTQARIGYCLSLACHHEHAAAPLPS